MFLYFFISFIIAQRLLELYIAKKNAIYIQSRGGFEVGKKHYPLIVTLHILFLVSVLFEGKIGTLPTYWYIPFTVFVLAQIARIWIILSLGRFWNTRIFILPNAQPIKKGPYRYVRHPNYLVVMIEMITISFVLGAYYTSIIFPLINSFILLTRIRAEEQALALENNYIHEMAKTPRFFPKLSELIQLKLNIEESDGDSTPSG